VTSRLVGLFGLVVAVACGSGQEPAADGPETTGSRSPVPTLSLEEPGRLVAGGPVVWRLTLGNPTGDDVTLAFTSGQQGEVVLTDADGTEAYRWSEGMVFAQALSDVAVPAGGEVSFELTGLLDVEPGTYDLEAGVPSDPTPAPRRTEVTVTG